jgi:two-component system sensor histidine kinase KdpD
MNQRPDPDQLLKHVQAEEESSGRGRLKLFFGASPGVGKTYAMLEAARQRKKDGWDVVVGLVETHKRAETEALLGDLEILPRKNIAYKGVTLQEFDLDAALKRQPRLILVDELAHTNAPGLRHAKRWQDVEELLDAGIDVYTTLNVQHWETLNDVVAQITGVVVHERVPDTFLKRVHDLELVDLAPEDLLKRLKDGKVYRGELAGRAAENFFQPGNLIALRELALRHTAERVDAQMQAFKERHSISEVWPATCRATSATGMSRPALPITAAISNSKSSLRVKDGQGISSPGPRIERALPL